MQMCLFSVCRSLNRFEELCNRVEKKLSSQNVVKIWGVGRVGQFCWEGGDYSAMFFLLLFFFFLVKCFIWLRKNVNRELSYFL